MEVEITVVVEVPEDTPPKDIQEWVEYSLGVRSMLKGSNKLASKDFAAERVYVH